METAIALSACRGLRIAGHFYPPGKSLPQRIRSPTPHSSVAEIPLSAVSHQNLRNSFKISSSDSDAPMYRPSPATRGPSASVLPPMWASIKSRRENRRVFPLTTRWAAALKVSWGTCSYCVCFMRAASNTQMLPLCRGYLCDGKPKRRVRDWCQRRRLCAMNEDDRSSSVERRPYRVVYVITYVL